jgi:hypothetical protein
METTKVFEISNETKMFLAELVVGHATKESDLHLDVRSLTNITFRLIDDLQNDINEDKELIDLICCAANIRRVLATLLGLLTANGNGYAE